MTQPSVIPVFFHDLQLEFKPLYEWAFGEKIAHPETTARAESILKALQSDPNEFEIREPRQIPPSVLQGLHHYSLLTLYQTASQLPPEETFYPMVFPRGSRVQGDPTNLHHAGYFTFDSGTPLNSRTSEAASWSAACARDAAQAVLKGGYRVAYALSRPPGHHATKDSFGGYCYFNNAAIAAKVLRRKGRVAILDIDFHHGNGTQSIFYRDPKVLVINVHGDPRDCYPYFCGLRQETGAGPGEGFNINVPLARGTDGKKYLSSIKKTVLPQLKNFDPDFLILSAGLDTYELDPVGDFRLTREDFFKLGELLGRTHFPMIVIQEGGYHTPHLGENARTLLQGVRAGVQNPRRIFRS